MQKYSINSSGTAFLAPRKRKYHFWFFVALAAGSSGFTSPALFAAEAKENWGHFCARCHGPDGTGNTKMGRKLRLKDLSTDKMQAKLSDADILDMILDGNQEDTGKDGMPSFKDKLAPEERQALVAYVRTLKK